MNDSPDIGRLWQKTEDWVVSAAREAYQHPQDHLLELGAATLAVGALAVATRGAFLSCFGDVGVAEASAESGAVRFGMFRSDFWDASPVAQARFEAWDAGGQLPPSLALDPAHTAALSAAPESLASGHAVGQATFAVAPMDVPLGTRGLSTCAGFAVEDHAAGLHYLAHVDGAVTSEQIANSLKGLNLAKSDLYVLPGPERSNVTHEIVNALRSDKSALQRLKFINPAEDGSDIGMISYKGKVFNITRDIKQWPAFEAPGATTEELAARFPDLAVATTTANHAAV